MVEPKLMDEYLQRIDAQLQGLRLTAQSRSEIRSELKSHLIERSGEWNSMDEAIRAMGEPSEIAAQFAAVAQAQKASRSFSPATLMSATAKLARAGGRGVLLLLGGLIGYSLTLGALAAAAMKVIRPAKVGFWIGGGNLVWGIPASTEGAQELAGNWFIPVSLWMAILFAVATTLFLRSRLSRTAPIR